MQIVTDSAADLSADQKKGLPIHYAPLRVTLNGKTYVDGQDLDNANYYQLLTQTDAYPTTSQVSAGEFAELYRKVAKIDPEILSIHISSGLSGTINSARVAASMVPEAKITFWDSKTLSSGLGWQVQAAAIAAKNGWPMEKILQKLAVIRNTVEGMFTMKEIRYLVHGGRISHIKGLIAHVLNIKPVIYVNHETGMYDNGAQEMTFKRAINKMVQMQQDFFGKDELLRVQIVHGCSPDGVEYLKKKASEMLNCVFEEVTPVAIVLGSHVGPSLTGIIAGPVSLFSDLQ